MNWHQLLKQIGVFLVLILVMTLLFMVGATYLGPQVADTLSPEDARFAGVAMLIVCIVDTVLLGSFILSARIHGWRLVLSTALLFYSVKTFQASIEAAYFMYNIPSSMAPRLFTRSTPVAVQAGRFVESQWKTSDAVVRIDGTGGQHIAYYDYEAKEGAASSAAIRSLSSNNPGVEV